MNKLISAILLIAFIFTPLEISYLQGDCKFLTGFTQSAWAYDSVQPRHSCMRVQEVSEATGDAKGATASIAGEMKKTANPTPEVGVAAMENVFKQMQREIVRSTLGIIQKTTKEFRISVLVIDNGAKSKAKWAAILKQFGAVMLFAKSVSIAEQKGYFEDPDLAFIINNDKQQKIIPAAHIKNDFTTFTEGLPLLGKRQALTDNITNALYSYIKSRNLIRSV